MIFNWFVKKVNFAFCLHPHVINCQSYERTTRGCNSQRNVKELHELKDAILKKVEPVQCLCFSDCSALSVVCHFCKELKPSVACDFCQDYDLNTAYDPSIISSLNIWVWSVKTESDVLILRLLRHLFTTLNKTASQGLALGNFVNEKHCF